LKGIGTIRVKERGGWGCEVEQERKECRCRNETQTTFKSARGESCGEQKKIKIKDKKGDGGRSKLQQKGAAERGRWGWIGVSVALKNGSDCEDRAKRGGLVSGWWAHRVVSVFVM